MPQCPVVVGPIFGGWVQHPSLRTSCDGIPPSWAVGLCWCRWTSVWLRLANSGDGRLSPSILSKYEISRGHLVVSDRSGELCIGVACCMWLCYIVGCWGMRWSWRCDCVSRLSRLLRVYGVGACVNVCHVACVGACVNVCDVVCVVCFLPFTPRCCLLCVMQRRGCVGCCDFCPICDACSWGGGSLMGSLCVSPRRCRALVSVVHLVDSDCGVLCYL